MRCSRCNHRLKKVKNDRNSYEFYCKKCGIYTPAFFDGSLYSRYNYKTSGITNEKCFRCSSNLRTVEFYNHEFELYCNKCDCFTYPKEDKIQEKQGILYVWISFIKKFLYELF